MNHYFFKQNCVFFFFIKIIKNKTKSIATYLFNNKKSKF